MSRSRPDDPSRPSCWAQFALDLAHVLDCDDQRALAIASVAPELAYTGSGGLALQAARDSLRLVGRSRGELESLVLLHAGEALAAAGEAEESTRLLVTAEKTLDPHPSAAASFARIYARLGDLDGVWRLAARDLGQVVWATLDEIAQRLGLDVARDVAQECLRRVQVPGAVRGALQGTIEAAGFPAPFQDLVAGLVPDRPTPKDLDDVRLSLANGLVEADDLAGALELMRAVTSTYRRTLLIWDVLGWAAVRAGLLKIAAEAAAASESRHGGRPEDQASTARLWTAVGDTERARALAQSALADFDARVKRYARNTALGTIACALAEAGDVDEARRVAQKALEPLRRPHAADDYGPSGAALDLVRGLGHSLALSAETREAVSRVHQGHQGLLGSILIPQQLARGDFEAALLTAQLGDDEATPLDPCGLRLADATVVGGLTMIARAQVRAGLVEQVDAWVATLRPQRAISVALTVSRTLRRRRPDRSGASGHPSSGAGDDESCGV